MDDAHLIAAALGVVAGVLAGLFGVGGGIVFVPALTLGVGLGQLDAEATSLAAMIPVVLLGSLQQHRRGLVVLAAGDRGGPDLDRRRPRRSSSGRGPPGGGPRPAVRSAAARARR